MNVKRGEGISHMHTSDHLWVKWSGEIHKRPEVVGSSPVAAKRAKDGVLVTCDGSACLVGLLGLVLYICKAVNV
jgi:hypothetical protein